MSPSWRKSWGDPAMLVQVALKLETIEPGEDASRPSTHTSSYRKEIHQLKRMLAEKAMEVDFFKGALQKVEARRQKKDRTGGCLRKRFHRSNGV